MYRSLRNYFPVSDSNQNFTFSPYTAVKKVITKPVISQVAPDVSVKKTIDTLSSAVGIPKVVPTSGSTINNIVDGINFLKVALETPKFPGERHAVLKVGENPSGTSIFKTASWQGPGTNIDERLKRDIKPLNVPGDLAAFRHDLEYSLNTGEKSVRDADETFLKNARDPKDYKINQIQNNLMKLKIKAEDVGVLNKTKFSGVGRKALNDEQITTYERELNKMKQAGYGKRWGDKDIKKYKKSKKVKPADRLRASSGYKKKKTKTKIPRKYRKKIDSMMDIEKQFRQERLPDNIQSALNMF